MTPRASSLVNLLLSTLFLAAVSGCAAEPGTGTRTDALRTDCSLVRCALPLCAEGQHLRTQGGCCPVCVGAPSRCATVLCAAVACADGEELVRNGNDCCGRCQPTRPARECATDTDCPQYRCFACPCPVSECQGNRCVTWTPDESTCGGAI